MQNFPWHQQLTLTSKRRINKCLASTNISWKSLTKTHLSRAERQNICFPLRGSFNKLTCHVSCRACLIHFVSQTAEIKNFHVIKMWFAALKCAQCNEELILVVAGVLRDFQQWTLDAECFEQFDGKSSRQKSLLAEKAFMNLFLLCRQE